MRHLSHLSHFVLTVTSVIASHAVAQTPPSSSSAFPTKPISLIVGYTPGGSVDLAARIIAPELAKRLGQPVVIDNAAGAGGQIGAQKAALATPDGHTLLLGTSAEIAVARLIAPMVKYDGLKDLSALGMIGTQPMVLVGAPQLPYVTTAELIAGLKTKPGKLSYGSAGNGSLPHLAGELFKQRSATFVVHIPYRGAVPMITDLIGNQVDLGMLVLSSALPQIKAGKLKAYGVTDAKRVTQLPQVPALAETKGLETLDIGVFFGLFAPSKTPQAVRDRVAQELQAVLALPEIQTRLVEAGFTLRALNAAGAAQYVQNQAALYRTIVESSKIKDE